jgi:hypothetical protein
MSTFVIRSKSHWGTGDQADDRATPFRVLSAATTNATQVVTRPVLLTTLLVVNTSGIVRFLKLYDSPTVPIAGQGTPVWTIPVPTATTGAGFSLPLSIPIAFNNGIGLTITANIADNDATAISANDVTIVGAYL